MPSDTQIERELDAIDAALEGRAVDHDLTELAELARALRDDRMEIDPFFSRELDAKAAAGFPRERRWRKAFTANPMMVPGIAASMLIALVVGVAMLNGPSNEFASSGSSSGSGSTALSDGESSGGAGGGATTIEPAAPEIAEDQASAPAAGRQKAKAFKRSAKPQSAGGAGTAAPAIANPPVPGGGSVSSDAKQARKVETSASLALGTRPENVQRVSDRVVETTDSHRGFVVSSSTEVSPEGGGATFELRIPSERLKPALADLSRLADVRERREATQDITQQFVSARSRLADARAERTGLLRQLAKATTDADRDRVKAQLRRVSARISAAKTDLARVDNRASYSTIAVSIVGDPDAGTGTDEGAGTWTPGDAADDALRVLEVAAGVALIALAIGLPLAILAAFGIFLTRLTQRRRRERLLDAI